MFRTGLLLLFASVCLHAAPCDDLARLNVPHTAVERAETIAAGAFALPSALYQNSWAGSKDVVPARLPPFCRLLLRITPVADSEIAVELWLPLQSWNGRFVAVGNGGTAGQINWRAMSAPLSRGYAVASTDTGHQGAGAIGDFAFAEGHPEKVTDFAWRAVHEMAVAGKQITRAYYGRAPQHSYWNGSSTGGRQGLKAAQMYPRDFDGIVAGAPAFMSARMLVGGYRVPLAIAAGAAPLSAEKLKQLHAEESRSATSMMESKTA
jgi:feruloyl esterase